MYVVIQDGIRIGFLSEGRMMVQSPDKDFCLKKFDLESKETGEVEKDCFISHYHVRYLKDDCQILEGVVVVFQP